MSQGQTIKIAGLQLGTKTIITDEDHNSSEGGGEDFAGENGNPVEGIMETRSAVAL